jgi:hypothetical protein
MINASFQIQILPSIFFFLARPFIKRAMAPLCSVAELLKDFRRRYRRREVKVGSNFIVRSSTVIGRASAFNWSGLRSATTLYNMSGLRPANALSVEVTFASFFAFLWSKS